MKACKILFVLIALGITFTDASAQRKAPSPVRFVYDADFTMNFDNREYDISHYEPSGTIFGIRLTPSVGAEIRRNGQMHTLMAGIDMEKDFGDITCDNTEMFSEITAWYSFRKDFLTRRNANRFEMTAGIFPKSKMKEEWSTAFFSDKNSWYDNNMEGVLFAWNNRRARVEFGCDWMGKIGSTESTREQFMILSAGHMDPAGWLRIGYNTYGVHYANSLTVKGVVDNILGEPYIKVDFNSLLRSDFFSKFYTKLGYLGSLQRDRIADDVFQYSNAGEFSLAIEKWNIKLENNFYYGENLMPLYNNTDAKGFVYGDNLYFQEPFFLIHDDGAKDNGLYNRLTLSYLPNICKGVKVGAQYSFHFTDNGLAGRQGMLKVSVNLAELMGR